jgi:lysophospholipase L1-like esterase
MRKTLIRIASTLLFVSVVAAPAFAARGSADFTRFFVIGDSYGAGVSSTSLNAAHQQFSWPAIIARQAGAPDFQQPLVSDPGIGPELQLFDISKFPPTIAPKANFNGQPINLNLPRPFNNLSIPGANVNDVITLTGREQPTTTAKVFGQFILRGLGTPVQQVIASHPTFIAIWIGGNDALGAVLSGTPAALTSTANFTRDYNAMLDQLIAGAPNAGIVVGSLPTHVAVAPIANTVAPVLVNPATQKPVLGPDGNPIFLVADLGGGNFGQLPAGSFVLLSAAPRLATGFGIPAALAPLFPTLPDVGKPLPDSDVLTPTEVATIEARLAEFNAAILASAAAHNVPVADIKGFFDRIQTGIPIGGITLTDAFLQGGIFSFDGFHMTDIGYTLFANEYIKTINSSYGTHIPLASITPFFANNAPNTESGLSLLPNTPFLFGQAAADAILRYAPAVPQSRRHLATH